MMGAALAFAVEVEQPIFENAGQAVHVSFLIMAQEATQDAPFRKALIRVMESIKLEPGQRHWLDQLRGEGSGNVNFEGLSSGDIRAQCALVTQAVSTNLPEVERWALQAKYGQTDFEDVADHEPGANKRIAVLEQARKNVLSLRAKLAQARAELDIAREGHISSEQRIMRPEAHESARSRYQSARTAISEINAELVAAETKEQAAKIAAVRPAACSLVDNGPLRDAKGKREQAGAHRRFAFSPERIAAIKGLSDWFAPMFPRLKPLAIDFMLGRMFANHKKIDISARDLAAQFGGSYSTYLRASRKMKDHLRILEEKALDRLRPTFVSHGVVKCEQVPGEN